MKKLVFIIISFLSISSQLSSQNYWPKNERILGVSLNFGTGYNYLTGEIGNNLENSPLYTINFDWTIKKIHIINASVSFGSSKVIRNFDFNEPWLAGTKLSTTSVEFFFGYDIFDKQLIVTPLIGMAGSMFYTHDSIHQETIYSGLWAIGTSIDYVINKSKSNEKKERISIYLRSKIYYSTRFRNSNSNGDLFHISLLLGFRLNYSVNEGDRFAKDLFGSGCIM